MGRCFVIQPFDNSGPFDRRYDDVLVPAIKEGGYEAYRIDRDPSVQIPIEEIQTQIELAESCLADISTDNPNVWFELGYAIACKRAVILICSDLRKAHFPFDVQHRSIIKYRTDSPSDFQSLKNSIATRLNSNLQKKSNLTEVAKVSSISKSDGLEQYELAVLVTVAQEINDLSDGGLSAYRIRNDLESAGFTKIAATLGIKALIDRGFLNSIIEHEEYDGSAFTAFQLTESGLQWLLKNHRNLTMKR